MREVEQAFEIGQWPTDALATIEEVGRDAYQSHDKTEPGSAEKFCQMIMDRKHLGLLEWEDIRVRIRTNRAVSHELVRHRLASYLQESQRYVNCKEDITFITPYWAEKYPEAYQVWKDAMIKDETDYTYMVEGLGLQPQEAREILPNSTATIINMKHNLRGWREIFQLRTAPGAFPPMRRLMVELLYYFSEQLPLIYKNMFDSIPEKYKETLSFNQPKLITS